MVRYSKSRSTSLHLAKKHSDVMKINNQAWYSKVDTGTGVCSKDVYPHLFCLDGIMSPLTQKFVKLYYAYGISQKQSVPILFRFQIVCFRIVKINGYAYICIPNVVWGGTKGRITSVISSTISDVYDYNHIPHHSNEPLSIGSQVNIMKSGPTFHHAPHFSFPIIHLFLPQWKPEKGLSTFTIPSCLVRLTKYCTFAAKDLFSDILQPQLCRSPKKICSAYLEHALLIYIIVLFLIGMFTGLTVILSP